MASEDLPANGHGGPADPAKPALRRTLRAVRAAWLAALAPGQRSRLEVALAARLDHHLPPGIIAGYHAMGSEIDPGPRAVYPRVAEDALAFHAVGAAALRPGFAGIAEPPVDAPIARPDIVLVPLIAVDRRGNRLGQGAGYYDRTVAGLRATGPLLVVGVAWDVQLVDMLPTDPWDAPLDALATPTRWLTFATPAANPPP